MHELEALTQLLFAAVILKGAGLVNCERIQFILSQFPDSWF